VKLRTHLGVLLGSLASGLSRVLGAGEGRVIGGRVCRLVDRNAARRLAADRFCVLVSGTNGKTATTALITAAFEATGPVSSNHSGANLRDGIVDALMRRPRGRFVVLEVDEGLLPWAIVDLSPEMVVMLNLTRDQLDRFHEPRKLAARWRDALAGSRAVVVANADDPLVVHAVPDSVECIWVAAGNGWQLDATVCPRCGGTLAFGPSWWCCERCGFHRPDPDVGRSDLAVPSPLPGRCNQANALMATVVARRAGVPTDIIAAAWSSLAYVGGRYRTYHWRGRTVRLLLAKNPAGWLETFEILDSEAGVALVLNARLEDGLDTSWIWDVPLEGLAGRKVVASGERAMDLAVRLCYAEVDCSVERSPLAAIAGLDADRVDVVANYSAFRQVRAGLERG
jgi:UDP-N-acetylmuramyl tripeptide synthase